MYRAVFFLTVVFNFAFADMLKLSGEQDGLFDSTTYLLNGVTVPEGKTLEFKKGSVLLNAPYTSLIVKGTMKGFGIAVQPQNADSQWNGIQVSATGFLSLDKGSVEGAIIGVQANDSQRISLKQVSFTDNLTNLKIGEVIINKKIISFEPKEIEDTTINKMMYPLYQQPTKGTALIPIARIAFGAAVIAGSCMFVSFKEKSDHAATKYKFSTTPSETEQFRNDKSTYKNLSSIGIAIAGIASPFFVFTLVIDNNFFNRPSSKKTGRKS